MKTQKLLSDIYYEQKATNRNLQRLSNIVLIEILARLSNVAKEKEDETGKILCKVGLVLAVLAEGLMLVSEVFDIKAKKINLNMIWFMA